MDRAQAFVSAEGNIGSRVFASGYRAPGVVDPVHAHELFCTEPGRSRCWSLFVERSGWLMPKAVRPS